MTAACSYVKVKIIGGGPWKFFRLIRGPRNFFRPLRGATKFLGFDRGATKSFIKIWNFLRHLLGDILWPVPYSSLRSKNIMLMKKIFTRCVYLSTLKLIVLTLSLVFPFCVFFIWIFNRNKKWASLFLKNFQFWAKVFFNYSPNYLENLISVGDLEVHI